MSFDCPHDILARLSETDQAWSLLSHGPSILSRTFDQSALLITTSRQLGEDRILSFAMADQAVLSDEILDVVPLIYVEVIPLVSNSQTQQPLHVRTTKEIRLSAPLVKLELLQLSYQSSNHHCLSIDVEFSGAEADAASSPLCEGRLSYEARSPADSELVSPSHRRPTILLPNEHPLENTPIPCVCRGFVLRKPVQCGPKARAVVTDATLVHVLPPRSDDMVMSTLTGEEPQSPVSRRLQDEVLQNHDKTTIQSLTLRLRRMLEQPALVGTTHDALQQRKRLLQRRLRLRDALRAYMDYAGEDDTEPVQNKKPLSLFQESCLLVHSPHHGHGKTILVDILARRVGCHSIHIIRMGPLLAKYGIYADVALETIIHGISVAAAVRRRAICIVLDQIDAMLPASLSNTSDLGDGASPVLNGILAYLRILSQSLKIKSELPFPSLRNSLYNCNGKNGVVLNVRLCLVGICTCPDDGWSLSQGSELPGTSESILDCMVAERYRLPELSANARLAAFRSAFNQFNLLLDHALAERLPYLAASAIWARGRVFHDVARSLSDLQTGSDRHLTIRDLMQALSSMHKTRDRASGLNVEYTTAKSKEWFASVGGNEEAKQALAESLLLDERQRSLFIRFGMKPPVGLMLYGPPGTGKTLLAKSVATILRSNSLSSVGGAFISVSSQDIVNSEVGSGEKILSSAFETARANSPAVIFLDEFQALFVERSRAGSGRLTNTLMHCMDDLNQWNDLDAVVEECELSVKNDRVLVLAATNTPWMIDKAFLRPGRFDRTVYVPLPTLNERAAILSMTISRMKCCESDMESAGDLYDQLARRTDEFSGADLVDLCRVAATEALRDGRDCVGLEHFFKALPLLKASTPSSTTNRIRKWSPK